MKAGKHQHIIYIWAHNWLGGAGGTYFIDMDLGEFTLSDNFEMTRASFSMMGLVAVLTRISFLAKGY
jgi:hypothetical protein